MPDLVRMNLQMEIRHSGIYGQVRHLFLWRRDNLSILGIQIYCQMWGTSKCATVVNGFGSTTKRYDSFVWQFAKIRDKQMDSTSSCQGWILPERRFFGGKTHLAFLYSFLTLFETPIFFWISLAFSGRFSAFLTLHSLCIRCSSRVRVGCSRCILCAAFRWGNGYLRTLGTSWWLCRLMALNRVS